MRKSARERRSKHARKIAACERKFPVYGFSAIKDEAMVERMEKMGIIDEE